MSVPLCPSAKFLNHAPDFNKIFANKKAIIEEGLFIFVNILYKIIELWRCFIKKTVFVLLDVANADQTLGIASNQCTRKL